LPSRRRKANMSASCKPISIRLEFSDGHN
jgi:hypothetical protein